MAADYSLKRAGNYTLSRKLGDGGFATVYLAQHTVLEKRAAVKLLLEEWLEEPDVVSRFFDEARTMESVSQHANIVKIIDIATKEKCQEEGLPPYFIMEYLEGKSLDELMKSSDGFSLEQIVNFMDCALSALQYCHDHGVIHRDIKPSNFMLDADGTIKLTDFGIAKAAENTSKTGEGLTLGSTDYMSPEQALGKRDLDYRSDIYSLGVTLYQLVCDRLPFTGDSANAVALKHIQEKPVPPIEHVPECPRRLNNIILKAMEKDRGKRFQSCNEMKIELAKLLDPATEDLPSEASDSGKTSARTVQLDLSRLKPDEGDDDFSRDVYDLTTDYTGITSAKMATRPPVILVNFLRLILVVLLATGFFLGIMYLYEKYTGVNLYIKCDPAGAKVYVNYSLVGTAPIHLLYAPNGYRISLEEEGYETQTKYFDTKPGESIQLSVNLRKIDLEALTNLRKSVESLEKLISDQAKIAGKNKKEQNEKEKLLNNAVATFNEIQTAFINNVDDFKYGLVYIQACEKFEKLDEAVKLIGSMLANNETAVLRTLLSIVYNRQGKAEEQKQQLDAAYIKDPNDKNVLNTYGEYYLKRKDKEHAKQFLEMSLFLYPEQPEIKEKLDKIK